MKSLIQVPPPTRQRKLGPVQSGLGTAHRVTPRGYTVAAFHASESTGCGGVRSDCSAAGISHDVRNMLAALNLYCDLLSEPAVLTPSYRHYAEELRLVTRAGGSLLERLARLATPPSLMLITTPTPQVGPFLMTRQVPAPLVQARHRHGETTIANLTTELEGCRELLAALAGPSIRVVLQCGSYAGPLPLNSEDLNRILINLVRNASEAMPKGGEIRIAVQANARAGESTAESIVLSVEDDGRGIAPSELQHLFQSGYTTKCPGRNSSWITNELHGLGLANVRGLVESAGGTVRASSAAGKGARFEIKLPLAAMKVSSTKDAVLRGTSRKGTE